MSIRFLSVADAEAQHALRARALLDAPMAFSSSPEDDRLRELDAVRRLLEPTAGHAALGAFLDGALVGMATVVREGRAKTRHKANLFGMFVAPEARGHKLGRGLLEIAIETASVWGVEALHLGVNSDALAAQALYKSAGFVAWGVEPVAVRHDGATADTIHMALSITPYSERL